MSCDIRSITHDELAATFKDWQEPTYRVEQVLQWLYVHRATTWSAMTNLPKELRERLAGQFTLQPIELLQVQGAADATGKFLWRLPDHALIESVLLRATPALYGEPSDRQTLCVSTQVGCAYGCKFCASGLDGWKRHLRVEEIVDQVLAVERWSAANQARLASLSPAASPPPALSHAPTPVPRLINNLVIMGMGEPLANYDNLLPALRILNAPWGGAIGARKITISTSGLAPQIRRLAEEPFQFRLAISLHGPTDAVRDQLMPVNRKHPLRELMAACEYYLQKKGRMITFEYILIDGVNTDLGLTKPLGRLAKRLQAKINLIPFNAVDGLPWRRPADPDQEAFRAALERQGVPVTLRQEKGHDIDAACGQLRLKTERALGRINEPARGL
jgi:23S rRNA (adenine2503-C2)-methyltransferase